MTEWEVIGVLIALVTFGIAVAKPIISLTKAITELTTVVKQLQKDVTEQETAGRTAHEKLWRHNDEQDKAICGLNSRVSVLEKLSEDNE